MAWSDTTKLESDLNAALDSFDWATAAEICKTFITRIKVESELIPDSMARRLLQTLRRKRCFNLMASLADAMLQAGQRSPQIRRQYAQALIDQKMLGAAEIFLQSILQDTQAWMGEEFEARGLMGRIYKQIYVDNNDPKSARNRTYLTRALNEYLYVYRFNPPASLWHGINVVALASRALRDNPSAVGLPDSVALATDILAILARQKDAHGVLPAWDMATKIEAHVALGLQEKEETKAQKHYKEAEKTALSYIASKDADAFEIQSTIRQFVEVWQLDDETPPGNRLLPILKAGYFSKQGAAMEGSPKKVEQEASVVGEAVKGLEKVFGSDKMYTLNWYKKGLEQCNSIARVERRNGKGHGTGWLVNASDFFTDRQGLLLLTNEHVISDDDQHPYAILPEDAQANFQALGKVLKINEIIWSSPYTDLDATFVSLEGEPQAKPLELHSKAMKMTKPPKAAPRMYIIGHPAGRDLELSLQDNYLLACNERLLHYRTPTEPGSSGSPVFEPDDWRVVALHHKGSDEMQRIDGENGTYAANEGIAMLTLQNNTREKKKP